MKSQTVIFCGIKEPGRSGVTEPRSVDFSFRIFRSRSETETDAGPFSEPQTSFLPSGDSLLHLETKAVTGIIKKNLESGRDGIAQR